MAKNRKKHRRDWDEEEEKERHPLHPDTKKSVLAVIFFALSLVLILSAFAKAGPAGAILYRLLHGLFGIGYFLLPATLLLLAALLLGGGEKRPLGRTLFGAVLLVFFALGLIDVISSENGGLIGRTAGAVENLFGYPAAIIITSALVVASLLVTLNLPLRFRRREEPAAGLTNRELKNISGGSSAVQNDTAKTAAEEEKEETENKSEPDTEEASAIIPPPRPRKIDFGSYVAPPLDLLRSSNEKANAGDLRANANIIKRTFESFNIPVEMGEINIGPKVTRYTLKPAEGVKLSRITVLSQDLALSLASHPIRIEAPIPGKSLVGIEVPNKTAAVVRLGNLMATPVWESTGPLGILMGRDVTGEPIIEDIGKMPHLLVAGATGSGKSVSIHTLLVSLLYKNSPEFLRLILIDPKRVELSHYHDLPHLVAPVVTQNKKAVGVFRWAIGEMEKRYELLEEEGARDLESYNAKISRRRDGEKLPYILIVVDELADLMSSHGRETEGYIVRISQMARAVGLHLILATQRPSVEIITGLIKANITTRVALKVASQIDSRTILDSSGAEKLLGGGDMLLISANHSKPLRIQGALITEEEIIAVTDFIRDHNARLSQEMSVGAPEFDARPNSAGGNIPAPSSTPAKNIFDEFADADDDEMLTEAITVVRESKKASASLLQRRLKLGYARAARLLDIMEERGIVGPGEGAKPREVYIDGGADITPTAISPESEEE